MMIKQGEEYALYVSEIQAIPQGYERYSFIPPHNRYLLIYSDKPIEGAKKPFAKVDESQITLNKEEQRWLMECKLRINAEFIKNRACEFTEAVDKFLEVFERELQKEQGEEE